MKINRKRWSDQVIAFRAISAAFAMAAASCVASPVQVRETSDNSLPDDLELPPLSGGVNEVADRVCHWAAENQRSFPLPDSVSLVHVTGPNDGQYEPVGVLNVFLQRERPRELTLALDPANLIGYGAEARRVNALIDQPGWWTFTKLDLAECATPERGRLSVHEGSLTQCVQVRRVAAPPTGATQAEYRDLHFVLSVGLLQQPLNVEVMTLLKEDRLLGRSVRAEFWAGPADVGRILRICEPTPVVIAFDSAGGKQ